MIDIISIVNKSDLTVLLNLTANLRISSQPKIHNSKSKSTQERNLYYRDFLGKGA